ncbi:MAG: alpha/beta fold hydrolase [Bacteroidota bacterium]
MLLIIIIVCIGIHFIAPYAITQPSRISEDITPDQLGIKSEKLNVTTNDGFTLDGYWIKSKGDSLRGIVIFVHGIGGCKEHFLSLSKELSELGIESTLFDGRAHGKSGGEFCTYGFREKNDIVKIVDKIKAKHPDLRIGIWGNSLGGAIAIQALEVEKRIDFGIIESTFTELDKIVFDYKKRILKGVGIKWLSDYGLKRAGQIADFDPKKIKPIQSVKNIKQPMLIAHGDADKNISVEYGKQLFENLRSTDKEFILVAGGGHFDLYDKGGEAYKAKLMRFIKRNLK